MSKTAVAPGAECWNVIGVRGDLSCPELTVHGHCRNCPVFSGAAGSLLDRPPPEGYLDEWTAQVAAPVQTAVVLLQNALLFRLGDELLALEARACTEIAPQRKIHSIPYRRGGIIRGIANVRGELVITVALERLLGIQADSVEVSKSTRLQFGRMIVIQQGAARYAFATDEVHGLIRYNPAELKSVPDTLARAPSSFTRALIPRETGTAALLDSELLFYALNKGLS